MLVLGIFCYVKLSVKYNSKAFEVQFDEGLIKKEPALKGGSYYLIPDYADASWLEVSFSLILADLPCLPFIK